MDELQLHIETMVDEHGLCTVLSTLVAVCAEKAEHIRGNWQDKATAKAWDHMGNLIAAVAAKCDL